MSLYLAYLDFPSLIHEVAVPSTNYFAVALPGQSKPTVLQELLHEGSEYFWGLIQGRFGVDPYKNYLLLQIGGPICKVLT